MVVSKQWVTEHDISTTMAQSMEQARKAIDNYLQFLQKNMSASPWARTALNEKLKSFAERNVSTAFAFADKLIKAKDFEDLVRIQTEFVQTQLQALSEQAEDVGETATKEATEVLKKRLEPSS